MATGTVASCCRLSSTRSSWFLATWASSGSVAAADPAHRPVPPCASPRGRARGPPSCGVTHPSSGRSPGATVRYPMCLQRRVACRSADVVRSSVARPRGRRRALNGPGVRSPLALGVGLSAAGGPVLRARRPEWPQNDASGYLRRLIAADTARTARSAACAHRTDLLTTPACAATFVTVRKRETSSDAPPKSGGGGRAADAAGC